MRGGQSDVKRRPQNLSAMQVMTVAYVLLAISAVAAAALSLLSDRAKVLGVAACLLLVGVIVLLRLCVQPRLVQHDLALKAVLAAMPRSETGHANRDTAPLSILIDETLQHLRTNYLRVLSRNQNSLMVLQNQINPHFLYNTLDCIRGEAMECGMEDVSNMVEALSAFFRYSISSGDMLVQLRDELRNIQIYYQIQKYRFRDRIRLEVDCPDERALDCYLPKLTLQPIIENCILHGLEMRESDGLIAIHIELTDMRCIITVCDNGCGMSPNSVDMLRQRIDSDLDLGDERGMARHGIALCNINRQLKLLFGADSGLTVSSELGVGTEMEIQIPAVYNRRSLVESEERP